MKTYDPKTEEFIFSTSNVYDTRPIPHMPNHDEIILTGVEAILISIKNFLMFDTESDSKGSSTVKLIDSPAFGKSIKSLGVLMSDLHESKQFHKTLPDFKARFHQRIIPNLKSAKAKFRALLEVEPGHKTVRACVTTFKWIQVDLGCRLRPVR